MGAMRRTFQRTSVSSLHPTVFFSTARYLHLCTCAFHSILNLPSARYLGSHPMETSSALGSFHYSITNLRSSVEHPAVVSLQCKPGAQLGKFSFPLRNKNATLVSAAVRTDEATVNSVTSGMVSEEKSPIKNATFPKGFETLLREVCDETEVAELKLKIGEFEMHVKRNVGATKIVSSVISPSIPPPIPSEPMDKSEAYVPPPPAAAPQKPSTEKVSPFTNLTFGKSSRLTALEVSGATGYVVVSSPTVGSFRRGRTIKGKELPPTYKEGDVIKEGQVIGWIHQFETELPIKCDVTGEVMKLLVDEGEGVGFGDPLIAVLPSFHGIR